MSGDFIIDKGYIVGHKGAGNLSPENTLFSFNKAAELELSYVEFDVRITADNVLVVSNRDNLEFCSGQNISISKSNYNELAQANVAHYHEVTSDSHLMPRLEEAVAHIQFLNLLPQIELKVVGGDEGRLAIGVAQLLDQKYADLDSSALPLITSFSGAALNAFNSAAQLDYKRGLLVHSEPEKMAQWKQDAGIVKPDYIHIYGGLVSEFGAAIHAAGYGLNAYKVNSLEDARKVIDGGVQRFTSDRPDILLGLNLK